MWNGSVQWVIVRREEERESCKVFEKPEAVFKFRMEWIANSVRSMFFFFPPYFSLPLSWNYSQETFLSLLPTFLHLLPHVVGPVSVHTISFFLSLSFSPPLFTFLRGTFKATRKICSLFQEKKERPKNLEVKEELLVSPSSIPPFSLTHLLHWPVEVTTGCSSTRTHFTLK